MLVASSLFRLTDVTVEYHPSKAAAIASGVVYAILTAALFFRLVRARTWWGLVLPIGCGCTPTFSVELHKGVSDPITVFAAGFFLRYLAAVKVESSPIFIFSQIFVIVSPASFLAFNYILYGRLLRPFTSGRGRYTLIKPEKVALIFISSDVVTFIVQVCVTVLHASQNLIDNSSTPGRRRRFTSFRQPRYIKYWSNHHAGRYHRTGNILRTLLHPSRLLPSLLPPR